jgi:hypothetical protein
LLRAYFFARYDGAMSKVITVVWVVPSAGTPWRVKHGDDWITDELPLWKAKEAAEAHAAVLRKTIPIVNVKTEQRKKKRWRGDALGYSRTPSFLDFKSVDSSARTSKPFHAQVARARLPRGYEAATTLAIHPRLALHRP